MATKYEQKQTKKAQQKKLVNAVTGTAVGVTAEVTKRVAYASAVKAGGAQLTRAKSLHQAGLIAGAIELVGNLGIAAWQFVTQKNRAKKQERLTRKQQQLRTGVDGILDSIESTGLTLVDSGLEPGTQEFELQLYRRLFQQVGYQGNCNIIAWAPGSAPGQANRPYLFKVTGNGRRLTPNQGLIQFPNLEHYWYTRCKNAKDSWVNAYIQKLTAEGRVRELEEFQASLKKGKLVVRVVFSLLASIMVLIFIIQAVRIK